MYIISICCVCNLYIDLNTMSTTCLQHYVINTMLTTRLHYVGIILTSCWQQSGISCCHEATPCWDSNVRPLRNLNWHVDGPTECTEPLNIIPALTITPTIDIMIILTATIISVILAWSSQRASSPSSSVLNSLLAWSSHVFIPTLIPVWSSELVSNQVDRKQKKRKTKDNVF